MSWRRIKSFLIILFLLINILLIATSGSSTFLFNLGTKIDNDVVDKTISVLNNNYGISVSEDIIPSFVENLNSVEVTNIIYTDVFENNSDFRKDHSSFNGEYITDIHSYNDVNSKSAFEKILTDLNIDSKSYRLYTEKSDSGIVCTAYEYIGKYRFYNGQIRALFSPGKITLSGTWYVVHNSESNGKIKSNSRMADITGILLDMASIPPLNSSLTPQSITEINYGYCLSYYDSDSITKSAPAIPCFLIKTDTGSKYYYDAISGLLIKQED